ncbi:phenylpyruvate tautomerase MIF-related protein [Pontiella agarivorans]|uniref:L-dopachrome isomerase n=1 Tax=Pontiella agarivorans TaxID=3038953 RepID=A0ABU5MZA3_9BACT|nr:phenylpyruvate tautomerase MIF-related protein [Pontiella agarivorans]MDZ8119547.1 phenylpyruvate tautomerase MIF-related protein [Pontiella agarivorans]
MPMLNLKCTKEIPAELLPELSGLIADGMGKPEQYIMVVAEKTTVMMSGVEGDAAFAEVKSLGGLNATVNRAISEDLCELLHKQLGIPPERIYINFQSLERDHWGWNGSTFG